MWTTRCVPTRSPVMPIALLSCAVVCLISLGSCAACPNRLLVARIGRMAARVVLCPWMDGMPDLQEQKPAWEGRFKCQVLLGEAAVVAAMAYVDLNPVRAKICDSLDQSYHTSAKRRITDISDTPLAASRALGPIAGLGGFGVLSMTQADYLVLVDFTGRKIRSDKRGAIAGPLPAALRRLGYGSEQWTRQVMAVGSSFNRAVGQVESLVEKAIEIGQFWLRGVSLARALATMSGAN